MDLAVEQIRPRNKENIMALPLIVSTLLSQGLSLIGNAVMAKGQDVIEEKLGITLKPDASPAELALYRNKEIEHEEFLLQLSVEKSKLEIAAEQVAQENVTERWKADMAADSWLSKNIRPMSLIYLTAAFTVFIVLDGFIESFSPDGAYVTLLAELLKMVYTAYFVGRSVEKAIEMVQVSKTNRELEK